MIQHRSTPRRRRLLPAMTQSDSVTVAGYGAQVDSMTSEFAVQTTVLFCNIQYRNERLGRTITRTIANAEGCYHKGRDPAEGAGAQDRMLHVPMVLPPAERRQRPRGPSTAQPRSNVTKSPSV